MKKLLLAITVCLSLAGCSPRVLPPAERVVYQTEYKNKLTRDSIYVHDSIYQKETADSVILKIWRTKYVDRLRTDTIRKTDSVYVRVPVVTNVLTKDQERKVRIYDGAVSFLNLILFVVLVDILFENRKTIWKIIKALFAWRTK